MEKVEEFKQLFIDRGFEIIEHESHCFSIRFHFGVSDCIGDCYAEHIFSPAYIDQNILDVKVLYNKRVERFLEEVKKRLLIKD